MVCDAGPTLESGVWQQNMTEKVGNRCPLTIMATHLELHELEVANKI